jgi:hypothetical protein
MIVTAAVASAIAIGELVLCGFSAQVTVPSDQSSASSED